MFLCYGQEEFFDCQRDAVPATSLNFAEMLEQRQRLLSRKEAQLEQQLL